MGRIGFYSFGSINKRHWFATVINQEISEF
jgi:hypothetical protein